MIEIFNDNFLNEQQNAHHFAPMLSTLNMNPKIILTRTPVNSPLTSPLKLTSTGATGPSTKDQLLNGEHHLSPYVLLEKMEKLQHSSRLQRTMANLKGLDMIQLRPPPTAVHMVQLPNPPTNSLVATANGLPGSSSNNDNNERQEQQQPQQDEEKKSPSSSSSSSSSSTSDVDLTPTAAGTSAVKSEDGDQEQVTLLSTPSVSIFQVAHRPLGQHNNAVLQPVAAVTGFNHPLSTPRLKAPPPSAVARSAAAAAATTAAAGISLSQLLAQSPSVEASDAGASNGPTSTTVPVVKPPSQGSVARPLRVQRRDTQSSDVSSIPGLKLIQTKFIKKFKFFFF